MDIVDKKLILDYENWLQSTNDSPCNRIIGCLLCLLRLGLSCSQELPSSRTPTGDIINELNDIMQNICGLSFALLFLLFSSSPMFRDAAAVDDELALLSFKSSLLSQGDSLLLASWNTSSQHCTWPCVVCGRRHPDRVVKLLLPSSKLSGTISPSLGNLSFLKKLDLNSNHLSGEIPPELGRLSRLRWLNLSSNFLQGSIPGAIGTCTNLIGMDLSSNLLKGRIPLQFGASMKNLNFLYLYKNTLSGEIPGSLAELPSIKYLAINSNRLSGEILAALGNLTGLLFLYLSHNMLSGEIPSSLGKLTNLIVLLLSENKLSGSIPSSFGQLPRLSFLAMHYNNLSGLIPYPIWNISSLTVFSVSFNMLSGMLPTNAFSNLPHLQEVHMANNLFHGHIPPSVANASNISMLTFGSNSFSGVVPLEIGRLRYLYALEISRTLLEAKEPNDWRFMTALTNCTRLQVVEMSGSKFGRVLPDSISIISSSLRYLSIQANKLLGTIPRDIGSLPSSFSKLKSLHRLTLDNNKLSGSLPLTIGNLTQLTNLELSDNAFSGTIPSTLGNLTKLFDLNLSHNNLIGPIPIEIFSIFTLSEALDVSYNNLEGSVPKEIGKLKNIVEFHANSNNLSGEIPIALGECQLLQHLFLQNNFLNGEIPIALAQLKGLDTLDISSNNLSGQIPKSLGDMPLLHSLSLSFNSFHGEVPINGVFANASEIYIQGNANLCGGIPELHLPLCTLKSTKKKKHRILLLAVKICFVSTVDINSLLYTILIIHKRRRKKVPETTSMQGHPMITYKQLLEATDGFSSTNLLGSGSFGSVYKGQLDNQYGENTSLVAVKVIKLETPKALKSFAAECEALRNMRHRNLVKIVTICSSIDNRGNDFKAIVYDFMPNKSLKDWLHPATADQSEQRHFNLHQRVTILLDVACALDYLHCHGPDPVVHCDIKSSNVLLDADMVAHVGDFGLARILVEGSSLLQQSTSSMGIRGTIGYAAPEYGVGNIASTHGDIYSYGILVLETVTGKRPSDSIFQPALSLRQYVEPGLHGRVIDVVDMKLLSDSVDYVQNPNDSPSRRISGCLVSLLRLGLSCSNELPSTTTTTMARRSLALLLVYSLLLCPASSDDNAAAVPNADELALLSFKSSLLSQGEYSLPLSSWNTSAHHCTWPGVVCGSGGRRQRHPERVVALRLGFFNLSGIISPSLGNLSFLRELNLSSNHFSGEIPPELGRLSRLRRLDLSNNQLQGMIPHEIGAGLKHLLYLWLYNNGLSGEISPALGNLTNLQELYLGSNRLSGAIPSSLGQLRSLSILSLGTNNLTGVIPNSIWNLSSLRMFDVRENMLGGMMPSNAFNALHLLEMIYMDTNHFHGEIPASLANASHVSELQITDNFFNGILPSGFGRLRNLTHLKLGMNLFQARETKDWAFITELTNCSQLLNLELGLNKFGGVLPNSFSNLSTSLYYLELELNNITGSIPKDIGNLIGLQYLSFSNNNFTGSLPSSLGRLKNLALLHAYKNNLSGSIPLAIGNLTELTSLLLGKNKFSGLIPVTLSNLTKLLELGLSTNNLSGPIPGGLFNIQTLSILFNVSHNNFEGSIPQEIGHLKNLVEFRAESNSLSGEIPSTLGECQLLRNLYLQNNLLTGRIPSALGQLKGLETLDLSSNNLSGQIPTSLADITMLHSLNICFNSFVGEVPAIGVFADASGISIQGNANLCGGIADLHLPPCYLLLQNKRHKFPVVHVVVPLVAALAILSSLCMLLTWHKSSKKGTLSTPFIQGHPFVSYSQLVKATDGFSPTNLLGSGSFGSVYKGKFDEQGGESTSLVAVKVLKLEAPKAVKSFTAECEALRNMRHRNLAKIVTICSSIDNRGNDFKAIVYDFMPNGTLEDWLHPATTDQAEQRNLNLYQRVTILLDVACALDYLHCHGPEPVVHCDIKSSNVLLDADMVAHVGDFGLARILVQGSSLLQHSTSSTGIRGTIGYAAPEYGVGNIASTHGDIYSYGILVLETITGKRPTNGIFRPGLSLRQYVEPGLHGRVMDVVDMKLVLDSEDWLQTPNDSPCIRIFGCLYMKTGDMNSDANQSASFGDELALLSFKSSLLPSQGDSLLLSSWNTSTQHCTWPGVVCGRHRRHPERVVALWLPSSNLSGTISPSIGNLSFLRELNLNGNYLSGEIPPELGRLSRLRWLDLSFNSFQGSIPAAIGECASLTMLDLSNNQLQGIIPHEIGVGLKHLSYLNLGTNGLSGEIPPALSNLTSLKHFDLRSNRLSGAIPS
uniref:Receptor kinase-like protein Xa21 n=1 Tax=Leersia perrieri TaxID=77586 RepID=A0A0D9XTD0_9ORYZ